MNVDKLKYALSLGAILLLILHLFRPEFGIDVTTIALLLVAALPFSGPLFRMLASSGVKNLELPGGIKIELNEAKAATDKVARGWANLQPPDLNLSVTDTVSVSEAPKVLVPPEDPIASIREVANKDPNLSLVAFRIEIEKRIRKIAENLKITSQTTSLGKLIRELQNRQILPPEVSTGLMDLVALGNLAAHGAEVEPNAAEWVLDSGASTILALDNILQKPKST